MQLCTLLNTSLVIVFFIQDIESENEDVENARSNKKSKRIKPSHKQSVSEPCTTGKYIPPSLRKLQENKNVDFEKQKQERLSKQLKGLLNRYFSFLDFFYLFIH